MCVCVRVCVCVGVCVWYVGVCVYVCKGHTLKPAALKCALAADCKVECDRNHRQRLTQYVVLIPRLL